MHDRGRKSACGMLALLLVLIAGISLFLPRPAAAIAPPPAKIARTALPVPLDDPGDMMLVRGGGGGGGGGHGNQGGNTYQEWESLSPAQKKALRQRMQQFNRMQPQERKRFNRMYKKWRQLPPGQRKEVQRSLKNWPDLTDQEKRRLREQFQE